jgi:hypothetical protein
MSGSSSLITSFTELVAQLEADKVPHRVDADAQVVHLPAASPALAGPLYIRWDKQLPFIQIVQTMINVVPRERVSDVEAAMGRLNAVAAFPGLGLEYQTFALYFRATATLDEGSVRTATLRHIIQVTIANALEFLPAMTDIVAGAAGADVIKSLMAKRAAAAVGGAPGN